LLYRRTILWFLLRGRRISILLLILSRLLSFIAAPVKRDRGATSSTAAATAPVARSLLTGLRLIRLLVLRLLWLLLGIFRFLIRIFRLLFSVLLLGRRFFGRLLALLIAVLIS